MTHPLIAQQYRLNMGTIVEAAMLKVRIASVKRRAGKRVVTGGRSLGELEEWFLSQLSIGDTFRFAGEVLRFEGLDEFGALATRTFDSDPMVPSYEGGKFPLSTYLAERVREILSSPAKWKTLPFQVQDWLAMQRQKSVIPRAHQMLVETFPTGGETLSGVLPVCRTAGPADAWHAADAAAGALGGAALGIFGFGICPGRSGRCAISR